MENFDFTHVNRLVSRGDIYYVKIPAATGHEMQKDRPAVVVSSNELNRNSPLLTVVMCSASTQREQTEHVALRSTQLPSTALCEHIYTVDKSRLGSYVGRCSPAEMSMIDAAVKSAIGLATEGVCRPTENHTERKAVGEVTGSDRAMRAIVRVEAERDTYKAVLDELLDRVNVERRAGA